MSNSKKDVSCMSNINRNALVDDDDDDDATYDGYLRIYLGVVEDIWWGSIFY